MSSETRTKTMTLNLPQREMDALEKLAKEKDMSKTAVIRQALRTYQYVDERLRAGDRMIFDGPSKRASEVLVL